MRIKFTILVVLVYTVNIFAKSVTSGHLGYKNAVIECAQNEERFKNFRQDPSIIYVYEHVWESLGARFVENILEHHPNLLECMSEFRKNELYGNPILYSYDRAGIFSPVTLRYIHILGEIDKMFDLTDGCKIAEVGVGYGGQCSVISRFINFDRYELIDLSCVLPLVDKYLKLLEIPNCVTACPEACGGELEHDLFISNYGISECSRKDQEDYMEKVIQFCKRGYILYNNHYHEGYSPSEFCDRLKSYGIDPQVREETIQSDQSVKNNVLIYWGAK